MLTHMSAKNFKSWQSLDLELGAVNLLFGENSSGKSSITQLLLLLKQTVESYDRSQPLNFGTRDSLVDLGSYEDIIFGHETSLDLFWSFKWKPKLAQNPLHEKYKESIFLSTDFSYSQDRVRVDKLLYKEMHEAVLQIKKSIPEYELYINSKRVAPASQELAPIKCYGFPPLAAKYRPLLLNDFSLQTEKLVERIYYLGPFRIPSQREYVWSGSSPQSVGRSGENTVQALLSNLNDVISSKGNVQDFVKSVEKWLIKMKVAESFRISQIANTRLYKVLLKIPDIPFEVNLADVGTGVSQVLPVVVLAHIAPENSIIIFEEPELHLHPSVQAVLGDMFFELSFERNVQFIVETHSEHLLTRLQRRIAESDPAKNIQNQIKLYVCKREQNHSMLEPLQLDESGQILNWPPNFMGDTVSDREAIMKAYFKRKKSGRSEEPKNE